MQWCKAHRHLTLEQWWRSLEWWGTLLFPVIGLDGQENDTYLLDCIVPIVVWWREDYGVVLGLGYCPLVPAKGTLNAIAYKKYFWMISCSQLCGKQYWKQFQHDCAAVHKARSMRTWMSEFGLEQILNTFGLSRAKRITAFSSNISAWSHKCSPGRMG